MKKENREETNYLKVLAEQYLAMSQKGTVGFYEETVVEDLVNYFLSEEMNWAALDVSDYGIALHPYSGKMHYLKAEVLYLEENLSGALYELNNAISKNPRDVDSFLLKSRIHIDMGRYEHAHKTLKELNWVKGEDASDVFYCQASIYESLDRHDLMFNPLCNALRANWDSEEILEKLGLCTEFSSKQEEFVVFLDEYLDERPYSSLAWCNMGLAQWHLGNYEAAAEAFEFAFLADEHCQQAYMDCAEAHIKLKDYNTALYIYGLAIEKWNQDGELHVGRGNCLTAQGHYDNALKAFETALQYTPNNAEGFYGKGINLLKKGHLDSALNALKKAVRLDSKKEEYAAALGEAYYRSGNISAAAVSFDRAIELAPETSEYWIKNIAFLMNENLFEEAFENIEAAFLNTFGTELKYCQAAYFFRTGDRAAGISMLQEAMGEDYQMHASMLNLCPGLDKDSEVMDIIATYRP